jgi:magnesium transporter
MTTTDEATATLRDIFASGGTDALRDRLQREHPADIGALVDELEPTDAWRILDLLPLDRRAEVFNYLIVTEMNGDDRADLFNRLTPKQQNALLPGLAQAEREDIRRLAAHEEGTAGAIMTSDYATLTAAHGARGAGEAASRGARQGDHLPRLRDRRRPQADRSLRLQTLILASPKQLVGDIMERETRAVTVDDDQEEVAQQIAKYDIIALPVVDARAGWSASSPTTTPWTCCRPRRPRTSRRSAWSPAWWRISATASIRLLYQKRVYWLVLLVFGNSCPAPASPFTRIPSPPTSSWSSSSRC